MKKIYVLNVSNSNNSYDRKKSIQAEKKNLCIFFSGCLTLPPESTAHQTKWQQKLPSNALQALTCTKRTT